MPTFDAPTFPARAASGTVAGQFVYYSYPTGPQHRAVPEGFPQSWGTFRFPRGIHVRPYPGGQKPPPEPNPGNGLYPGNLTNLWHTMTDQQRATWKRLAKYQRLPLFQTFTAYNRKRHRKGLPPVTTPN